MAILPMAVYGLEVPAGDILVPAGGDIPASFRITMAAIDPTAIPDFGEAEDTKTVKPRATLKIIRAPIGSGDDDDEDDFDPELMDMLLANGDGADSDEDDEESEEESDDEATNGGPSDPAKSKKARKAAATAQLLKELEEGAAEGMDVDDETAAAKSKAKGKGKAKAIDISEEFEDDDDEDDDEDMSDDEDLEPEEFVLCTLDPEKNYQQTLDITIGEDEEVYFQVTGTHSVYLTGNYVTIGSEHDHDHDHDDDEDDDEYDLSPDEDELDYDDSEDELDDLETPRITEVSDDEAPELVKSSKKGKNKRAAEESADESSTLDDLIAKGADAAPAAESKLSKKQQKKLKTNEGKAVPADEVSKKSVQFAKNLEQGPTGTAKDAKKDAKAAATPAAATPAAATAGVKTVQGVTIDDKKAGSGAAAKKGDRISMRYIGKLKDGKVFDSNKKGKPFSFKLGAGEVIKGWDIGIAGIQVGGERRITVPAHLAYGSQSLPGIPPKSTLVFDVKCVDIKN